MQEISQPYIRDKSEVYPLPSLFNRWNGSFQNKLIWEIINMLLVLDLLGDDFKQAHNIFSINCQSD